MKNEIRSTENDSAAAPMRALEAKYRAQHSCDELGGLYPSPMMDGDYPSLAEAREIAQERTGRGQCGCVIRLADEAVLAPDGSWVPLQ